METATKLGMKLLIDTRSRRILFAEANKEVVDFVFTILSLPLGIVTGLLREKQGMVGCLGNLYKSVEDLDSTYLQPKQLKDDILIPKVANLAKTHLPFSLSINQTLPPTVYWCNRYSSCLIDHVSFEPAATCPNCIYIMDKQKTCVGAQSKGFVKGLVNYMIMDDLTVKPMSAMSIVDLMNEFNVKEVGAIEEKFIDFSVDEGEKMLKASLVSKTVLTDVFLGEILKSEN